MAASSGDPIDKITMTIVSATLGAILLCSFALPTIFGDAGIGGLDIGDKTDTFKTLLATVGIVLVMGLIIPIVRGYNRDRR